MTVLRTCRPTCTKTHTPFCPYKYPSPLKSHPPSPTNTSTSRLPQKSPLVSNSSFLSPPFSLSGSVWQYSFYLMKSQTSVLGSHRWGLSLPPPPSPTRSHSFADAPAILRLAFGKRPSVLERSRLWMCSVLCARKRISPILPLLFTLPSLSSFHTVLLLSSNWTLILGTFSIFKIKNAVINYFFGFIYDWFLWALLGI